MQLGVHKRKAIYSGPKNEAEWSRDVDESKGWKFSNGALVANGPASGAANFETPAQFILKFSLKWQANPNFQIYFADPLTPKAESMDRYYMQFNGAGLEIKREASKGKHFQTVILLARTPDQFANNQMDVEIRVDRKASRLTSCSTASLKVPAWTRPPTRRPAEESPSSTAPRRDSHRKSGTSRFSNSTTSVHATARKTGGTPRPTA